MKKGINMSFKSLMNNKYVLYLVGFLSFLLLLNHLIKFEFAALLLFYVVGLITYYYTKNMTIVLGVAFLTTSVASAFKQLLGFKEGFKEGAETTDATKAAKTAKADADAHADTDADAEAPADADADDDADSKKTTTSSMKDLLNGIKDISGGSTGEPYQNIKLTPGLYNMPNKKQVEKQLGKASELESAYDSLEKVIGNNKIKSMSGDTKELIKQQNELLGNMVLAFSINSVSSLCIINIIFGFSCSNCCAFSNLSSCVQIFVSVTLSRPLWNRAHVFSGSILYLFIIIDILFFTYVEGEKYLVTSGTSLGKSKSL